MWVRAVATAVAVWCVSGAAIAAGYGEVWNPPEAAKHATGHARKTVGSGALKHGNNAKATPRHAAGGQHGTQRVVSTPKNGAKPSHGGVKKVAVKGGAKGAVKHKASVAAQGKKPHALVVQAKPGRTKPVRADLAQAHTVQPHALKVAAKTDLVEPPAPRQAATTSPVDQATNPATASSGSLPPILH